MYVLYIMCVCLCTTVYTLYMLMVAWAGICKYVCMDVYKYIYIYAIKHSFLGAHMDRAKDNSGFGENSIAPSTNLDEEC